MKMYTPFTGHIFMFEIIRKALYPVGCRAFSYSCLNLLQSRMHQGTSTLFRILLTISSEVRLLASAS